MGTALCFYILSCLCSGLHIIQCQEVTTSKGRIRGTQVTVLGQNVDVFHGIPFAKPPIGNLRFKYPESPPAWHPTVLDAGTEKPSCLQPLDAFTFPEEYRQTPGKLSEDCLYMNLWRPSLTVPRSNLSVMVWIYGGGWATGSSRVPLYNGQYLAAENNVIVVSFNYRLGPLGFGFLSKNTVPGNMALLDQVLALKWVREEINNFGGDAESVTIFGESAGAVSVGLHLLSPLSRDMFKYAILQSGSPMQSLGRFVFLERDTARKNFDTFVNEVGCTDSNDIVVLECLQHVQSDKIIPSFMKGFAKGEALAPIIDGNFLPADTRTLMNTGQYKQTHILQGFNKDESTVLMYPLLQNFTRDGISRATYLNIMKTYFRLNDPKYDTQIKALRLFYEGLADPFLPTNYIQILNDIRDDLEFGCRAVDFSSYFADSMNGSSYVYSFNHRLSTSRYPTWVGATHSYELEFVFGLPLNESRGFTQEEKQLSRIMMTYWTNFAKSGNPNLPVLQSTKWIPFDTSKMFYMDLDVSLYMATRSGLKHQQCNFINNILPLIKEGGTSLPHKPPIIG